MKEIRFEQLRNTSDNTTQATIIDIKSFQNAEQLLFFIHQKIAEDSEFSICVTDNNISSEVRFK